MTISDGLDFLGFAVFFSIGLVFIGVATSLAIAMVVSVVNLNRE